MGAFNIVHARVSCPSCHSPVEVLVQFKYGDTWQYEYQIGDALRWGGNQVGEPGAEHVVIDGTATNCPVCGYDGTWDLYVFVEGDRIVNVDVATGAFDFVKEGRNYIEIKR